MTALLRMEELTVVPVKSPQRKLVNQVSFVLESGKTTCVVGESGSGKSLTALSVMGLLSEQLQRIHGRVIFQGRDLASLSPEEMRGIRGKQIGMIFQEPMTSLNPVLKVGYQIGESLTEHLGLRGKALRAKVGSLLEQVGIPAERADSYPDELSGGQRQRVMIAMSIACEPAMLIADEPTTALDVTVQAQILKLLDELKTRMNMGMLFITHDFGVVADIADDVVVMFRGEIVESGPVAEVLGNPQHPYTKALLDCVPDADGKKPLKPIDYAWLTNGAHP
ncbi:peptide/nickel transport system ATP-binding protein [Methylovorus glucosotrophus]|jgi:peptide/nickel transport system ATP-binding protein|uniref:ATP-binding cassette domain-containing protein n=1 Tax=Methylovorus glucosotrophus TaxID=266009 RepID=UPI0013315695|nr:ABC transporter ATP-binding protein [Methylovorus glucosotrophus]KAF0843726.1 peptide/nickel transport system ATP-binding protein [Methylovorus glucosotrophus]